MICFSALMSLNIKQTYFDLTSKMLFSYVLAASITIIGNF